MTHIKAFLILGMCILVGLPAAGKDQASLFVWDETAVDSALQELNQLDEWLETHPGPSDPGTKFDHPYHPASLAGTLPFEPYKDFKLASSMAFGEYILLFWWFPLHRIYLGTTNQTLAAYILTCGGCGFITLIDAIVLLIDEEPQRFVDNPQFIMW